jgi:dTDP-4-dehydrorhamnose 3,5-epimerase
MNIQAVGLEDSFIITPSVFNDARGFFYEFFNEKKFKELTQLDIHFIQDNLAKSDRGVLRGLHFQQGEYAQAKLVSVLQGSVLDVIVDIRKNSPTFGQHFTVVLNAKNKKQLFIPSGFAHGYLCLEDQTLFFYKIDNVYNKESESGIIFNDKDLNIDWNFDINKLILSDKDKILQSFKEYSSKI